MQPVQQNLATVFDQIGTYMESKAELFYLFLTLFLNHRIIEAKLNAVPWCSNMCKAQHAT